MSNVMEEVHLTSIKPKNNVLLLAQEIAFVRVLAGNDKRQRDRCLRRLKKWFKARSQGSVEFTKDDFMIIWKGLFYSMWMSDKPLIQEALAEDISSLIHSFETFKASLLFIETFFSELSVEWSGIDQLRMDKFMMLVRRFVRQSLECVAHQGWKDLLVKQLAEVYERALHTIRMGLSMHFIEIFCEELAKVGKGELSSETILCFIAVFARVLATLTDGRMISQISRRVFLHLIHQSELGIEHQMKFSVWKEHGFRGGNVDAVEKVELETTSDEEMMEVSDEEAEEEERLVGEDARAGKVDVLLPPLDFDPRKLIDILVVLRNKKETTTKARKTLIQLISKFETLSAGKYPLGLHKVELPKKVNKKKEIAEAAKKLMMDEQKMIYSDNEDDQNIEKIHKKRMKKLNKIKVQKQSTWKISESDNSDSQIESPSNNSSWAVSEAVSSENLKPNDTKKRKSIEGSSASPRSKKKIKTCINDIKENSLSSLPVASTPTIRPNKDKRVLTKVSPSDQNISHKDTSETNNSDVKKSKKLKNKGKRVKRLSSSTNNPNDLKNENPVGDDDENNIEQKTNIDLNTSTSEKNNGWGGEWEEPAEDTEYEMFIPNKRYVEKRKSLGLSFPTASFIQKSAEKLTPLTRLKRNLQIKTLTPGSQKKVEFNLSANCSQEYKEYTKSVKRSKSKLPFDATKRPAQGLLKNSTPSPINPFYKKKLKLSLSPVKF